jgi:phosphoribosylformimino-5-aminoimidazole carboxamide ribotide isomerase
MKIIPAIDIMDGQVVRLYRGDPSKKTVYGSDPVDMARRWEAQGAHMLHVVDLDATLSRGENRRTIRDIAGAVSIPVQAAGGFRSVQAAGDILDSVERVVIGTLALDTSALGSLAGKFGRRLVVAVDHRNGRVVTHGWQRESQLGLERAVLSFMESGATQFLVTDVSRDGTLEGPDMEGLGRMCRIRGADTIASGGVSGVSDVRVISSLDPYGVILGKALYENMITIPEALQC